MICDLCAVEDERVEEAGGCQNKCVVRAHPECLQHAARKKNMTRVNRDWDVCPMPGCLGKFKPRTRAGAVPRKQQPTAAAPEDEAAVDYRLDDPSCPCGFLGRDGLPCRRKAVANGACRLHARDAAVTKRLTADVRAEHAGVQATPDVTSRGTQTPREEKREERKVSNADELRSVVERQAAEIAAAKVREESLRKELETLWNMHERTLEAERHATRLELRNQLILLFDTLP